MKRFIRTYQNLIISGGIVLFSFIAVFAGIVPGIRKVQELVGKMAALNKEVTGLREKDRILQDLDVDALREYAIAAVSAVPAEKSLGTLFSTVDGLTAKESVAVTSVSLGSVGSIATESANILSADEQKTGAKIIPFSLVVEGEIEKVRNVLDSAVKIRRLFRVLNFSLSFDEKSGFTRSTLSMNSYYVGDPQMKNEATTPIKALTDEELNILDKVTAMPLLTADTTLIPGSGVLPTEPVTPDPFTP